MANQITRSDSSRLFFVGLFKKIRYTKSQNLNDLRQRILDEVALIPIEYFENAIATFYH